MEKSFGLFFYLKKENRSDDNKLKVYMRITGNQEYPPGTLDKYETSYQH
ncbi:MAG: hypothetical protein M3Z92_06210 [Bacteroidota bacterium]|nr:hypothetical protein [Bacteroidota bacterium]